MARRRASRWIPTAAMMLLSLLSYVDRNVLAILSPTILRETHITAEDYGWIISAFSFAYLVGNPVWGKWLDRFGVRAGVAVAAALWTCASAAHALATGVVTFAVARAVLGFGEGATFPAGMRTATHTLAPASRARGIALAYSGGSLGAILTPLVITPVALRWGWRGAFVCTGVLGAMWLAMWFVVSKRPELAATAGGPATPAPSLAERSSWGFMAAYALGGLPIGFVLYGAPIHLGHALGCDQRTLGHVLWLPPLGWEIGYFFWGWRLDRRATKDFTSAFAMLALLSLPLALAPFSRSIAVVLALLVLATFTAAGFVVAALAEVTHRHSTDHGAYLAGLGAGAWSGVMVVAMPLFGWLFDRGAFGAAYAIATACPVAGWLLWRALRRTPAALLTAPS